MQAKAIFFAAAQRGGEINFPLVLTCQIQRAEQEGWGIPSLAARKCDSIEICIVDLLV